MAEPLADQILRKIGEQQAKASECPTLYVNFYGNTSREVRTYAA